MASCQVKSVLNQHGRIQSREETFCCEMCDKRFNQKRFLKLHFMRHGVQGRQYTCDTCGASYKNKPNLAAHMKQKHDPDYDRGFDCVFCKKKFLSNHDLRHHLLSHIQERPYFCQICSHETAGKSSLKNHMRIHDSHRERKFGCALCSKKFFTRAKLQEHVGIHLYERLFPCGTCGKAFRTSTLLKAHQQIHSTERRFKCQRCPKAFKTSGNLNQHRKIHDTRPRHYCPICQKPFQIKGNMDNHIRRMHTNELRCKCEICGKEFKSFAGLKRHNLVRHQGITSNS